MSGVTIELKTTPNDKKHYPATNQAHYCWQKYNEFVLCQKKNPGDKCMAQKQLAWSICPDEWMSNWETERKEGKFMGIQEKAKAPAHDHH